MRLRETPSRLNLTRRSRSPAAPMVVNRWVENVAPPSSLHLNVALFSSPAPSISTSYDTSGMLRAVRTLAIAVRPVVPASADKLLDQLGIAADARDFAALGNAQWFEQLVASGFTVAQPVGVFPRLELPAEPA